MSSKEQIGALIERVGLAFGNLDVDAWLACFHSQRMLVFPQALMTDLSDKEVKLAIKPTFESLKDLGLKRTELEVCNIRLLTDHAAIVSTVSARYDQDENFMERLGATYMVNNIDGTWLIGMLLPHSSDTLLVDS